MSGIILIRNPEPSTQGRAIRAAERMLIDLILRRTEALFNAFRDERDRKVSDEDLRRLKQGIILDYKGGVIPSLGELLILRDGSFHTNIGLIFMAAQDLPA